MSQQFGCIFVTILSPYLLSLLGWRFIFFVPGVMALLLSLFLFNRLRDTPESLNLPSVEKMTGYASVAESDKKWEKDEEKLTFLETLKMALGNKFVWYVSFANFFLYICRMTIFYWGPTFLLESKGSTMTGASIQMVAYDLAGMFGGVAAGYISDKVFNGRRGPVSVSLTILLALMICGLWASSGESQIVNFACMMSIGFLVTGPQILVGVAAAGFASKKAAATASGFTGTIGAAGSALAGWGVGHIADNYGWNAVFLTTVIAALAGSFFFMLTWNERPESN
jgi:sugar phosphate permease